MYFQLCHMCGSQQLNHAWCFDNRGHIHNVFLCDLVLGDASAQYEISTGSTRGDGSTDPWISDYF